MSSWGRCQDALYDLFDYEDGSGVVHDGPAKAAGIDRRAWSSVMDHIIEAVYPIAHAEGVISERRVAERTNHTTGATGTQNRAVPEAVEAKGSNERSTRDGSGS